MRRVFVSCAYPDRAVGERVSDLLRSLGHEAADDHDDAQQLGWWDAVVRRIEASDVFVAVASPAYVDAQTCRLAAKHAAARGLPVVRVDLDRGAAGADCHPVVAAAPGVPFAPDDPGAVAQLAEAVAGPPPAPEEPASAVITSATVPPTVTPATVTRPSDGTSLLGGLGPGPTVVVLLGVVLLVLLAFVVHDIRDSSGGAPAPQASATATSAAPTAGGTTPPGDAASPAVAGTAALLDDIAALGSPRLPSGTCRSGAAAVTCTNPSANIRTVVLTPYETPAELYRAYAAAVEGLSGADLEENTGNCSTKESEGELGWNLSRRHTLDFSVTEQAQGGLDPSSESAGRVFCTAAQQVMTVVWTQDPGLLVTVTGQPSELVIAWWSKLHLQLACADAAGAC